MAIFEQIDDKICNIEILDFQTPKKNRVARIYWRGIQNYIVMTSRNT